LAQANNDGVIALRLYLDSADVSEWDRLMPSGLFYGITTNPLLAARAGLDYGDIDWLDLAKRAKHLGATELHGQIVGDDGAAQEFAQNLYEVGAKVGIETVIKIPLTQRGIFLTPKIQSLGGKVLMTACYSAKQMIIAQALGATYIAPYVGRMGEAGLDAMTELRKIKSIGMTGTCRPLLASLRSVAQIIELIDMGHDCFTIAPSIADALMSDPLTDRAAAEFEAAATAGE
jgi:transaldolase